MAMKIKKIEKELKAHEKKDVKREHKMEKEMKKKGCK